MLVRGVLPYSDEIHVDRHTESPGGDTLIRLLIRLRVFGTSPKDASVEFVLKV